MIKLSAMKKIFLITFIVTLCLIALVAIGIFVSGQFGEIELKILLTILAISGYSLTALSNTVLWNKKKHPLGALGILFSLLGFIVATIAIWNLYAIEPIFESIFKIFLTFAILSFSTAHAALLLTTCSSDKKFIQITLYSTLFFIALVAALLLYLVLEIDTMHENEFYRALGVCLILDALGTIVTPLLKKMNI